VHADAPARARRRARQPRAALLTAAAIAPREPISGHITPASVSVTSAQSRRRAADILSVWPMLKITRPA